MERKRKRPSLEMNPPSADPQSATPAVRSTLLGSVVAAFNGPSISRLFAFPCHSRVLSCLIPFPKHNHLLPQPPSIRLALAAAVQGCLCVAWVLVLGVFRSLTLNPDHSHFYVFLVIDCSFSPLKYCYSPRLISVS